MRILHTMLRVRDLERSLAFYTGLLGMTLFRREDYPTGRFTLAFIGYGQEETSSAIELTYNWDSQLYEKGDAWGHIAIGVSPLMSECKRLGASGIAIVRPPGPMAHATLQQAVPENIAFIEDPDGYRIELVEQHYPG